LGLASLFFFIQTKGIKTMRVPLKFKVQVSRRDGSTVHGVIRAFSHHAAIEQLRLPVGYSLAKCEEIPVHQACFFDREFDGFLPTRTVASHD